MTGKEILNKKNDLMRQLNFCLSTMEKKDDVRNLRKELKNLTQQCPHHDSELNFALIEGTCPYCGGKILND